MKIIAFGLRVKKRDNDVNYFKKTTKYESFRIIFVTNGMRLISSLYLEVLLMFLLPNFEYENFDLRK